MADAVARVEAGVLCVELTSDAGTSHTAGLLRVLDSDERDGLAGAVIAGWQLPDGKKERGPVLAVR